MPHYIALATRLKTWACLVRHEVTDTVTDLELAHDGQQLISDRFKARRSVRPPKAKGREDDRNRASRLRQCLRYTRFGRRVAVKVVAVSS